jgi:hypothetical protein
MSDFEVVPVAPIITGITFVRTLHSNCISFARSLYFRIFSPSFLDIYYYYYYYYYLLLLSMSSVLTTWLVELLNLTSGCPLHMILTYYNHTSVPAGALNS